MTRPKPCNAYSTWWTRVQVSVGRMQESQSSEYPRDAYFFHAKDAIFGHLGCWWLVAYPYICSWYCMLGTCCVCLGVLSSVAQSLLFFIWMRPLSLRSIVFLPNFRPFCLCVFMRCLISYSWYHFWPWQCLWAPVFESALTMSSDHAVHYISPVQTQLMLEALLLLHHHLRKSRRGLLTAFTLLPTLAPLNSLLISMNCERRPFVSSDSARPPLWSAAA